MIDLSITYKKQADTVTIYQVCYILVKFYAVTIKKRLFATQFFIYKYHSNPLFFPKFNARISINIDIMLHLGGTITTTA